MNKQEIKTLLIQKENDYLTELIIMLLYKLDDKKRLDFTAKYINAKVVLSELNGLETTAFLQEVSEFCELCLDGQYYIEAEYDDYSDSYDEDEYIKSEWAKGFAKYFHLAVVHARNEETSVAYRALERLFNCIAEAQNDNELLGTHEPLEYIDIDVNDAMEVFLDVMLRVENNITLSYSKIFDIWLAFEKNCNIKVNSYIKNFFGSSRSLEK